MTATVHKGTANGLFTAPPSKSMAHRYLICGALSGGSVISGAVLSDDIRATLECLEALGASVSVNGGDITVGGLNPFNKPENRVLKCGESGSTLRFMLPLCLLASGKTALAGSKRLLERPLTVYEDICRNQNIEFIRRTDGIIVDGVLRNGVYEVGGDISSQFVSGLMLALPLLEGDSIIRLTSQLESVAYLNLTIKALADFGVRISRTDGDTYYIKGRQSYRKRSLPVEGDYSNAAFFAALNTLGGSVRIEGLNENSSQGDMVYAELFSQLSGGGGSVDITDCPDLAPVLFAVAAAKHGGIFTGTRRLRYKESDRAVAMRQELAKFGVNVIIGDNTVEVVNAELHTPSEKLYGHNDHRIVMALAVLCTLTGGEIEGAQAVSKSFPDFFERLSKLGIGIDCNES